LKKWLKTANKDVEVAKIEEDYEKFSKDMRWMLVENKISKENNLQITYDELSSQIKELLRKQFAQYGMELPDDAKTQEYIQNILANQDEARKISADILEKKLYDLFNTKLSLKEKEVTYDEFLKSLNEKPKFNLFNKLLKF
jgi:trigger factor